MKEPGQIAYETFRDLVPAHYPWDEIAPSVKAYWAAVEAACRAEGMREAAGIAAKHANGSAEWSRHATVIEAAILSAIGGQKNDGQ